MAPRITPTTNKFPAVLVRLFFFLTTMLSLALAMWGWMTAKEPSSFWDALYLSIQLIVLQGNEKVTSSPAPPLAWARFLLPIFSWPLIISAVVTLLSGFWTKIRLHYIFSPSDYVIGDGGIALTLAQSLAVLPARKVALIGEFSEASDDLMDSRKFLLIHRNPYDFDQLQSLGLGWMKKKEKSIYLAMENDVHNVELLRELHHDKTLPGNATIQAHSNSIRLRRLLRKAYETTASLYIFCAAKIHARSLLNSLPPPFSPQDGPPRILILGDDASVVKELVLELVRRYQSLEMQPVPITIVAPEASQCVDTLCGDFPALGPGRIPGQKIGPLAQLSHVNMPPRMISYAHFASTPPYDAAYICSRNDEEALTIIERLTWLLDASAPKAITHFPFAVLHHEEDFEEFVDKAIPPLSRTLSPVFVWAGESFSLSPDEKYLGEGLDTDAKLINFAYASKADHKQPCSDLEKWILDHNRNIDLPNEAWQKIPILHASNRYAADHISIKMKLLGNPKQFDEELASQAKRNLNSLMRLEHNRFCAERMLDGWRWAELPYNKDIGKRLNKTLCPWGELPSKERHKDKVIVLISILIALKKDGASRRDLEAILKMLKDSA